MREHITCSLLCSLSITPTHGNSNLLFFWPSDSLPLCTLLKSLLSCKQNGINSNLIPCHNATLDLSTLITHKHGPLFSSRLFFTWHDPKPCYSRFTCNIEILHYSCTPMATPVQNKTRATTLTLMSPSY